jgi:hypothetical protein
VGLDDPRARIGLDWGARSGVLSDGCFDAHFSLAAAVISQQADDEREMQIRLDVRRFRMPRVFLRSTRIRDIREVKV